MLCIRHLLLHVDGFFISSIVFELEHVWKREMGVLSPKRKVFTFEGISYLFGCAMGLRAVTRLFEPNESGRANFFAMIAPLDQFVRFCSPHNHYPRSSWMKAFKAMILMVRVAPHGFSFVLLWMTIKQAMITWNLVTPRSEACPKGLLWRKCGKKSWNKKIE